MQLPDTRDNARGEAGDLPAHPVSGREINLLVIHCTATPNGLPVPISTIRAWHLDRGFRDIGYHYVIQVDGSVMVGRPEEQIGAHAAGHNTHSLGISLVGGTGGPDKLNPGIYSIAQWESLRILVHNLLERYPEATVCGHRDLSPDLDGDGEVEPAEWIKLCPSFDVRQWMTRRMTPDLAHVRGGK
jgi:N-acetylmuramoyl-L-alanine amidase